MIPVLVDGDVVFWESNAIMQYLCAKVPSTSLWPANAIIQADISRWQFWHGAHFGSTCSTLVFENLKKFLDMGEPDQQEIAKAQERFHRFAQVLEQHLKGREYLVGDSFTLADFAVASSLAMNPIAHYPLDLYKEIKRWYADIEKIPAWQSSASNFDIEV
jgi:glutathione S-transferase